MHRYAEYVHEALEALWQNRTRSILTMLGMIIGTSSVIAVFGVSRATASGIAATLGTFGVPPVFIQADLQQEYPQKAAIQYRDLPTIRAMTADLVDYIDPEYERSYPVRVGNTSGTELCKSHRIVREEIRSRCKRDEKSVLQRSPAWQACVR